MQRKIGERGGAMVIAMVSLTGLLGLGALTILTVSGGLSAASNDRFQTVALYAAESGIAAGMVYLRQNHDLTTHWSAFVSPSNQAPQSPAGIPGNGIESGDELLLGSDSAAWYEVAILNNGSDPSFAEGSDTDAKVILRSLGHGPNGATAIVEVEVAATGNGGTVGRPCPGYGQRGMGEDNAGRNDCLTVVDGNTVATFKPGG